MTGSQYVGGIVGTSRKNGGKTTIEDCFSSGVIEASYQVGGLVGKTIFGTDINTSYSSCTVTSSGGNAGGFTGNIHENTYIINSYSTGDVVGNVGGSAYGGFCGNSENSGNMITKCYSTGNVFQSDAVTALGSDNGFLANGPCNTNDNFFDNEASNQSSATGATAKTTSKMQDVATFTDENTSGLTTAWDFETNPNDDAANNNYWDLDNTESVNSGYPFLSWQNGTDTSLPDYASGTYFLQISTPDHQQTRKVLLMK